MRSASGIAGLFALALAAGMAGCSTPHPPVFNDGAALTGKLPWNPEQWSVITSLASKADSSMSTLYGNDAAVSYARSHATPEYPAGSVLSLVTWTEKEDGRWFGGKIPGSVKSVEFVSIVPAGAEYQRYEGSPLQRVEEGNGTDSRNRAQYLLNLRAAVMP